MILAAVSSITMTEKPVIKDKISKFLFRIIMTIIYEKWGHAQYRVLEKK